MGGWHRLMSQRIALWGLVLASVWFGIAQDECSLSTLDCGSGYTSVVKANAQTVTHGGCTVKIYHKECYCGSSSNPTSCCVDQGNHVPFKSIYCSKNGDADNQSSDLPKCAEAMLSW